MNMLFKMLFRVAHLGSFAVFFGNYLLDYLFGKRVIPNDLIYKKFSILCAVAFGISGIVNMIILIKENKYVRNRALTVWKYLLYLKVLGYLLFSPLGEKFILPLFSQGSEQELTVYRIVLGSTVAVLSSYTRFYREANLTSQKRLEKSD